MEPSQGIETEGAGSFNHVNTQALISKITQRVLYYDILSLQKKLHEIIIRQSKRVRDEFSIQSKRQCQNKCFDTAS